MKRILICGILLIVISVIGLEIWKICNINQKQVPVLVYHDIVKDDSKSDYDKDILSAEEFDNEMKYLKENGYETISADELYEWKQGKRDISDKTVVITFDDGFYSFKHVAQPILKKYNFKAVCFLIGNTVGENTKAYENGIYATIGMDEVKNHDSNITYGSHTFDMHKKNDKGKPYITSASNEELENDTQKFDQNLFDAKYIAYPFYTYSKEYIQVLKNNGYNLGFAGEEEMATKTVDNYKVPRISGVKEFTEFKKIFETDKYRNRYGNGIIRKIMVTLKRKLIEKENRCQVLL